MPEISIRGDAPTNATDAAGGAAPAPRDPRSRPALGPVYASWTHLSSVERGGGRCDVSFDSMERSAHRVGSGVARLAALAGLAVRASTAAAATAAGAGLALGDQLVEGLVDVHCGKCVDEETSVMNTNTNTNTNVCCLEWLMEPPPVELFAFLMAQTWRRFIPRELTRLTLGTEL